MAYRAEVDRVRARPGGLVRVFRYDEGLVCAPTVGVLGLDLAQRTALGGLVAALAVLAAGAAAGSGGPSPTSDVLVDVGLGLLGLLVVATLLYKLVEFVAVAVGIGALVAAVTRRRQRHQVRAGVRRAGRRLDAVLNPGRYAPHQFCAAIDGAWFLPAEQIAQVEARRTGMSLRVTVTVADGRRIRFRKFGPRGSVGDAALLGPGAVSQPRPTA
ncbi:MAG: hypothetical protein WCA46_06360 [Actinocatenispora sp.]